MDVSEEDYRSMEALPRELFKVIIFSSKSNFSILWRLRDVSSWLAKLIVTNTDKLAEFFAEEYLTAKECDGMELLEETISYELPNGIKHGLCFERNYNTIIIETETLYRLAKRHGWTVEKCICDKLYQTNCSFYVDDLFEGFDITYLHNIKTVQLILRFNGSGDDLYVDFNYDDNNQIIREANDYDETELKFTNFPKNIDHDTLREWLFATLADPMNAELSAKLNAELSAKLMKTLTH